jgi:hypothetical protein
LALPFFNNLTEAQVERVVDVLAVAVRDVLSKEVPRRPS